MTATVFWHQSSVSSHMIVFHLRHLSLLDVSNPAELACVLGTHGCTPQVLNATDMPVTAQDPILRHSFWKAEASVDCLTISTVGTPHICWACLRLGRGRSFKYTEPLHPSDKA
jgi:hypothetical protein